MQLRRCTIKCFYLLVFLLFWNSISYGQSQGSSKEKFEKKIIAKGLHDPWTIKYGPDNHLWVTESKGYRVLRIDPANGDMRAVLDLNEERHFPHYNNLPDTLNGVKPWPQGGLMGMALHPELPGEKPYVYLAFAYKFEGLEREGDGRHSGDKGVYFRTKLVRYTYDGKRNTLVKPMTICDTIPGSNDHNGGRLLIFKVEGVNYLFYSVGDMGAGQYHNAARTNHAQNRHSYEGKVLRFLTEPTNEEGQGEGWIPEDNPFNTEVKSAVWSLGHRNPQGLTYLEINGKEILYSSEHGPFSDDEINIIKRGGNYGHPLVIGYADGNYDGLSAGISETDSLPGPWNTTYPLIVSEQDNARSLENYQDPMLSFNPSDNNFLEYVAKEIRKGAEERPEWESIAPSGITSYKSDAIPSWKNSLLLTSLKQGAIFRLKLNAQGDKVIDREEYFKGSARYRDIAVSSDGKKIYLVTDRSIITSGPTEEDPESTDEQGAIIEYSYIHEY